VLQEAYTRSGVEDEGEGKGEWAPVVAPKEPPLIPLPSAGGTKNGTTDFLVLMG